MKKLTALLLCLLLLFSAAGAESILMTFTGDCTFGSEEAYRNKSYSFDTCVAEKGYTYFMANMQDLFTADDLTIINLEGVLSDSNKGEDKSKEFRFRGPTDFVNIMTLSSIEGCGIANNHVYDFGVRGYQDTFAAVDAAGLMGFGTDRVGIFEKNGVKLAFFAFNTTKFNANKKWMKSEIQRLKTEENVNAVIFLIHTGREYNKHRTEAAEQQAHYVVDCGADLVIMHHPHVVQGIEVYKGRTICYSLGNFCFGGNKDVIVKKGKYSSMEALVVRARLDFDENGLYMGQQIDLIPVNTSATKEYNNFQPLCVTGEKAAEVLRLIQIDTKFTLPEFDEEAGCAPLPYLNAEQ